MLDEEFIKVNTSLLNYYPFAEIGKNCFVITKEDLSDGKLKEKGILQRAFDHLNKFNSFLILIKVIEIHWGKEIVHPIGFFVPNKFERETNNKETDV